MDFFFKEEYRDGLLYCDDCLWFQIPLAPEVQDSSCWTCEIGFSGGLWLGEILMRAWNILGLFLGLGIVNILGLQALKKKKKTLKDSLTKHTHESWTTPQKCSYWNFLFFEKNVTIEISCLFVMQFWRKKGTINFQKC